MSLTSLLGCWVQIETLTQDRFRGAIIGVGKRRREEFVCCSRASFFYLVQISFVQSAYKKCFHICWARTCRLWQWAPGKDPTVPREWQSSRLQRPASKQTGKLAERDDIRALLRHPMNFRNARPICNLCLILYIPLLLNQKYYRSAW